MRMQLKDYSKCVINLCQIFSNINYGKKNCIPCYNFNSSFLLPIHLSTYFCNMSIATLYKIFEANPSVVTDTRKVKEGDIFFALKGPNFNGNIYAKKALELGASFCVCDEKTDADTDKVMYVEDVLTTLQALAKHHREQFTTMPNGRQVPFIAITGSNGKTTTKELVYAVLNSHFKAYTTQGNLNNHIGVPLTILSIKKDAEIAVIEMGANHQKEIESYCTYTLPTHGLINNCGKAHLEGFGGVEGVRKGKGELYTFIAANNGTIFINNDYDYLIEMSKDVENKITYGTTNASVTGTIKADEHFLEVNITCGANIDVIKTQLAGNYNLSNVLSAVCIGKTFGVPDEKIKAAIENYVPSNSRSQIIEKESNTILLDAYNANPSSMKAAIENFAKMSGQNKIVILGGMMELGEESIAEHTGLVNLLQQYKWEKIVLAGKDYTNLPEHILHFTTSDEVATWFKHEQIKDSTILIKGSRGMAMEKVIT
jgi:UDP-N-acetylmuramoyl-tripeptide--D-alanyl-D-alanine ligase